jgi:hypothetical protein
MLQLAALDDLETWQPPDLQTLEEARAATAQNLKPLAWKLLNEELGAFGHRDGEMDARDLKSFLSGIENEMVMLERAGSYPAVVYEEFSPSCRPRTAALIEALSFLLMRGRVAIIQDHEVTRVNDRRERVVVGYKAQLCLF